MNGDTHRRKPGTRGRRRGVAADELRRHNLSTLLERLHLSGPVTRSHLTRTIGLNRSTVADLIAELAELGLVEERRGSAASGPGRPSAVVQCRPQGAVALVVELGVDAVALATIGLSGHQFNHVRVSRPRGRFTVEETVTNVAQLAGPLLAALPRRHRVIGVGVAVAGVTRRSDGFVHVSPNLGWRDVPLAQMLTEALELGHPVVVANEADLGALAEHRRGAHAGASNLIYVSGDVGIGCGLIMDGRPMSGTAGYSGEAGHTLVNPDGQRCRCGAIGCWETEAGEIALLRHLGLADEPGHLDEIAALAEAGDDKTLAAIAEVGHWLGAGIGNLVNLFNPEVVTLGGMFQRLHGHLAPTIASGFDAVALAPPAALTTIESSALGPDAALVGAAELVHAELIADPAGRGHASGRGVEPSPASPVLG